MKQNKYLAVTLLLAFIFSALISLPITYAETADITTGNEYTAEIEETTATNQSQIQVSNADDCVTYTAQQKTLQITRGSFDDNSLIVTNGAKTFAITSYDWYIVEYMQSFVLVADVTSYLTVDQQAIPVAIFLYPAGVQDLVDQTFDIDTDTTSTIRLLYTNINQTECHKIIAPVSETAYQQIYTLATEWDLSRENDDDVSESLIDGFSYENNYKMSLTNNTGVQSLTNEQVSTMATNDVEYANLNANVTCNSFDSYTDTDKYIADYISELHGKSYKYYSGTANVAYSDDPIVNLIPKYLFTRHSDNAYSYLGKEYGFFILPKEVDGNLMSSFLVFDIQVVEPYPQRLLTAPAPSVKIVPIASGIAFYIDGNVITQEHSDPNLALANIDVAVTVCNATQKNIGDTGYVPSADYGYAMGSYSFRAAGVGPKKETSQIDSDILKVTIGMIDTAVSLATNPSAMDVASALIGIAEIIDICTNDEMETTYNATNVNDGEYSFGNSFLQNGNTVSMIANYTNLVKGFTCSMRNDTGVVEEEYPLLLKDSEHYFYVEYSFCQSDDNTNWDALVSTQITVDIYQDNTRKVLFIPTGEIELLDRVTGGRVDTYNEIPITSFGGTIQEDKIYRTAVRKDTNATVGVHEDELHIPMMGSYKDYYFTPNRTHLYIIDTFNLSPGADSYLMLFDSQNNLIVSNDDGGGNKKARISRILNGGQTYKIRTLCYNYKAGAYDFIIRKHDALTSPTQTVLSPTNVSIQNDSVWLAFTPAYDGYYSFTTRSSADSVLTLYDSEYNKYTSDDDSGVSVNALINMYLLADKTYYLQVHAKHMGSGQFSVYVTRQKDIFYNAVLRPQFDFDVKGDSPQYFSFMPAVTQSYTLTTKKEIAGDPYIEIYDSSWNLLVSDDDSGDGNNPQITYTFSSGITYYIKIKGYNSTAVAGYLYFV